MTRTWMAGLVLALAAVVQAAPNVAQTTQKGSLLVFPDIDVRSDGFGNVTTIVRIQNDANRAVWVKCYYMGQDKQRTDFAFLITRGQPVWFDASTGAGTIGASHFPGAYGAGLLACFAVDADETQQIRWNHLSGTATVVDYDNGTAYEYSAWAFYANANGVKDGEVVPPPPGFTMPAPCDPQQAAPDCTPTAAEGDQVLGLDGVRYDKCPATLIGQFSPWRSVLGGDSGEVEFDMPRAVFVGCNLDLRQAFQRYDTKLTFDVWNENELKLTGAHDCADGWHEKYLGIDFWESDNFLPSDLKTDVARYRVTPTRDDFTCAPTRTARVGLIGVHSNFIAFSSGDFAVAGTHLAAAGGYSGFLVWNAAAAIEEGTVR